MSRDIVLWPDRVLSHATAPVTDFGPPLQALVDELLEAVRKAEGIGIAANQLGFPLRVALIGQEGGDFFEVVNPELRSASGPVTLDEGCLSLPGEWEHVPRFSRVSVRYQDRSGAWQEREAEGRLAHVFQHEIDHLDGMVYPMRLSALKRDLIRKRMLKRKRG